MQKTLHDIKFIKNLLKTKHNINSIKHLQKTLHDIKFIKHLLKTKHDINSIKHLQKTKTPAGYIPVGVFAF